MCLHDGNTHDNRSFNNVRNLSPEVDEQEEEARAKDAYMVDADGDELDDSKIMTVGFTC
jgi:hypothetical protein